MKRTAMAILFAAATAVGPLHGAAQEQPTAPAVVELFTSQACSSCLGAVALFNDLADREDVIALGWHVDYWNDLPTAAGAWVDPYSSAQNTDRQRRYNVALRSKSSVYTPQMVIDGAFETIGSKSEAVLPFIERSNARRKRVLISASRSGRDLQFNIGANAGGEAFLIYFRPEVRTQIKSGENAGEYMIERNVVQRIEPLGTVPGHGAQFVAQANDELSCALIVQTPGQGDIIAARYCPA